MLQGPHLMVDSSYCGCCLQQHQHRCSGALPAAAAAVAIAEGCSWADFATVITLVQKCVSKGCGLLEGGSKWLAKATWLLVRVAGGAVGTEETCSA
jgi:hypothetical protein